MNDRTFYDEAFFAELDQPIPLRKQVVTRIDRYCATTGKSHSFAWRKAYLELEDRTGYRGPDKKTLDAIEKAEMMAQLLDVVKSMCGPTSDFGTEVNKTIPELVPHRSDREGWKLPWTVAHAPIETIPHVSDREGWPSRHLTSEPSAACAHEWGVFSTVLEDVTLLVQCAECGAYGKVSDPSAEEWQRAFHAPSQPYHWPDSERVELLPGEEDDDTKRHMVKTGHRQVRVRVGQREADVDEGISELIEQLWLADIGTGLSCEENQPGIAWIDFDTPRDARRFLTIVVKYESDADSLYKRATESEWQYDLHLYDYALFGEDFDQHPGRTEFWFSVSIRFPRTDMPVLHERLKRHNVRRATMNERDQAFMREIEPLGHSL